MDYEKFENLNPKDQADIFDHSDLREKGELLLRAQDPRSIIRKLSQEEFYLITREMDVEERSEVVKHASLPQLVFMSDLECWSRDRIQPKQFLTWLETLRLAGDDSLLNWLVYGDYQVVVAGLKTMIQVIKAEREYAMDELLGDKPYFTLDENYFITVREDDLMTVRRVFEVLFERHRGRYVAILEGVISEIDDPLEEEAFKEREGRMSDRGFPDFESAQSLYKKISDHDFKNYPKKRETPKAVHTPSAEVEVRPNYLALFAKERFFLDEVLLSLSHEDEAACNTIREEMVWISNKVIAAQGMDLSSEKKVRWGVTRARAFVSLGLQMTADNSIPKAASIARDSWLETLFRKTVTELYVLRDSLQQLIRQYWNGDSIRFLQFLPHPYEEIVQGVLKPVPEYWEPKAVHEKRIYRDFMNLNEFQTTKSAVEQVVGIHDLFKSKTPNLFSLLAAYPEKYSGDFFAAINTLFLLYLLGSKIEFKLLSEGDAKKAFKVCQEMIAQSSDNYKAQKISFIDSFISKPLIDPLRSLWSLAFSYLEDEVKKFQKGEKDIDQMDAVMIEVKSDARPKKKHG